MNRMMKLKRLLLLLTCFLTIMVSTNGFCIPASRLQTTTTTTTTTSIFSSAPPEDDREIIFIEPGTESDILSDELWEEVDGAQPPKWLVMKEILGIGGFTYALGALIVVMLSLNFFLGPGWLGQAIGVPGTGSFTEVSPNLPETVDLSDYTL